MCTYQMIRQDNESLEDWKQRKYGKTPKQRLMKVQNDSRVILSITKEIEEME